MNYSGEKNYNTCKLEDGRILDYDLASSDRDAYNDLEYNLDYLGKGTHFTCNSKTFCFYKEGREAVRSWRRINDCPYQFRLTKYVPEVEK